MLRPTRSVCHPRTLRQSRRLTKIINLLTLIFPPTVRRIVQIIECLKDMLLLFQTHSLPLTANIRSETQPSKQSKVSLLLLSTCCLGIWSGELVVSTTNNVLIGTIKKRCSLCCSQSFIGIENE